MINPARFAQNYSTAANSLRPGPKTIREGSVKALSSKAKQILQTTHTPKFKGKPLPI